MMLVWITARCLKESSLSPPPFAFFEYYRRVNYIFTLCFVLLAPGVWQSSIIGSKVTRTRSLLIKVPERRKLDPHKHMKRKSLS